MDDMPNGRASILSVLDELQQGANPARPVLLKLKQTIERLPRDLPLRARFSSVPGQEYSSLNAGIQLGSYVTFRRGQSAPGGKGTPAGAYDGAVIRFYFSQDGAGGGNGGTNELTLRLDFSLVAFAGLIEYPSKIAKACRQGHFCRVRF
jgi:hypothetical protein